MASGKSEENPVAATNRRARHDYFVEDSLEVGIELRGPEVKSVRAHHVSLAEAHAELRNGELWLIGMHITPYAAARNNPDPLRVRKLLASRLELHRLERKVQQKGYTLIPLKLYFADSGYAKIDLGLCRGKKEHDKREAIAERDAERRRQRGFED